MPLDGMGRVWEGSHINTLSCWLGEGLLGIGLGDMVDCESRYVVLGYDE